MRTFYISAVKTEQHCGVVDPSQGEGVDSQEFHHDAASGKERQTRGPWRQRYIITNPYACMVYLPFFTYIWAILFGQMLVNIPYMEHMGSVSIPLLKSHKHTLWIINVAMDNG